MKAGIKMTRKIVESNIVDGANGKGNIVGVKKMESVSSNPGATGRSFNSNIVPLVPVIDSDSTEEEETQALVDAKKIALDGLDD